MTVVESPKGRASHNLGNRGAIPTFPPPGYCYIFFQNLSRKESSSPPAPSLFRLILRLEKTNARLLWRIAVVLLYGRMYLMNDQMSDPATQGESQRSEEGSLGMGLT